MTTLFIDYEGGNDNYGGTSFALLASGTDGRITSTTFSAATASFPNDGSLIGQYLTIWNASIYACYQITAWVSGTELTIAALSGGTALANQAVDRQYYIGGRWKTITSGHTAVRAVAGDNVRLMASPEPTLVGNATWTGTPELTSLSITSSTNATPIVVTKAGHGLADNDYVLLTGHTTNTNANGIWQVTYIDPNTFSLDGSVGNGVGGATGGFRKINNAVVELAAAKTQLIAGCSRQEGAWTASANVTATVNTTDYKNHYGSASIAIGAAFTTGMAAYFPTGTLNLGAYEQVSFWIKQTAGTVMADADLSITLCSDAAGATPVDTISVPSPKILNYWMPVTVDTSAALGASIQSCALVVNTDNGAQTFLIGEVIGCLPSADADSLSLTSLIGKNTTGETFVGIQSINGTRVVLDCHTNYIPSAYATTPVGYSHKAGTTETVATYKRETVKITPSAVATTTTENKCNDSGTYGSLITYSGGWDRTAMTTQSGETWWDGQNGAGIGFYTDVKTFINIENLAVARFNYGVYFVGNGGPFYYDDLQFVNCTGFGLFSTTPLLVSGGSSISKGCNYGVFIQYGSDKSEYQSIISRDCVTTCYSFQIGGNRTVIKYLEGGNVPPGTSIFAGSNQQAGLVVQSGHFSHATATFYNYGWPEQYLNNIEFYNVTSPLGSSGGASPWSSGQSFFHNYNGTADDHRIAGYFGQIVTDATMPYDATTAYSWKFSPTTTDCNADWPLDMKLRGIALAANVSKTISVRMARDNTGLTMRLMCKGGQLAGIANDVYSDMTYGAYTGPDDWEEVSVTLTPTETGAVELEVQAFGGATYNGWLSKMRVV